MSYFTKDHLSVPVLLSCNMLREEYSLPKLSSLESPGAYLVISCSVAPILTTSLLLFLAARHSLHDSNMTSEEASRLPCFG